MECMVIPLVRLKAGGKAKVLSLQADGAVRRRMLDLGLIEGTQVVSLYRSPSGNPMAYMIRGAVIALRADVAKSILVEECL